ncbi:peptidoglycan-binding protein [Actinoplanes sp. NBRC 101535]|uniref:efflux RND transporter periplasmic adaptor subunit n=1 Tax=Actinoplanes sp. NBRC 101535 TaxID=3032196 RepID=UPI0024A2E587|nr:peptidoglycan-binding protein [Actinoplanes sp. NBRC 101535]GLY01199.1 hypothetical protein Acsp01_15780 [Actinoplanes sp. NBRC 101535]
MTGTVSEGDPARRRRRLAILVPVIALIIGAGGLAAATVVQSPEEKRAEAAAPELTVLTAAVERRVLTSTLVTRGTVVPAGQLEVTPVVDGAAAQVVTALHIKAGRQVARGQVMAAVSGRPLIALPGKVPGYRDLKPGDSGTDIIQLQTALRKLGHYAGGDRKGYYGGATKKAVRALYAEAGYDTAATDGAGGRTDAAAVADAQAAVDEAKDALTDLDAEIAAAAPAARPALQRTRARLVKQAARARTAYDDLVATTGPMVPHSEYVFVPSFPARVASITAKVGQPVTAPFLTLAIGDLAVSVKIRRDQAALVHAGMAVEIASETLGENAKGTVTRIGALTTDPDSQDAAYHPMTVDVTGSLDDSWADQDVRVSVVSAETEKKVLVVPLSAVSAGADGKTTVTVAGTDGTTTRIEVRAGVSGDGYVEVDGELTENDRVVVGASR